MKKKGVLMEILNISTDVSVDISTDVSVNTATDTIMSVISAECWLTYCPTIGRYSGQDSANKLTIECPGIFGQLLYNESQKLRLPVMCISCFFVQPYKFVKALCLDHLVVVKQSLQQ